MALIWLPELTNWCRKATSALLLQVWHVVFVPWHIQTGTCLQTQWIQMIKLDCWSQYGYDLRSQFFRFHEFMDSPIFIEVCSELLLPLWQRRTPNGWNVFQPTFQHRHKWQVARSLQSWILMSWVRGSDPGDVVGGNQLVHCKQDIQLWVYIVTMSRFRIFQEVPASAAAVPWGLSKFHGLVDLCRAQGECLVKRVCSSGQWSVLRCRLVSWCPTSCDAEKTSHWDGKEWVEHGRTIAKHVTPIHRHTWC